MFKLMVIIIIAVAFVNAAPEGARNVMASGVGAVGEKMSEWQVVERGFEALADLIRPEEK